MFERLTGGISEVVTASTIEGLTVGILDSHWLGYDNLELQVENHLSMQGLKHNVG